MMARLERFRPHPPRRFTSLFKSLERICAVDLGTVLLGEVQVRQNSTSLSSMNAASFRHFCRNWSATCRSVWLVSSPDEFSPDRATEKPTSRYVTFDEQTDPQLVRAALEDLLRKGALRWVGLEGNNVQVWRTEDITQALDFPAAR